MSPRMHTHMYIHNSLGQIAKRILQIANPKMEVTHTHTYIVRHTYIHIEYERAHAHIYT